MSGVGWLQGPSQQSIQSIQMRQELMHDMDGVTYLFDKLPSLTIYN